MALFVLISLTISLVFADRTPSGITESQRIPFHYLPWISIVQDVTTRPQFVVRTIRVLETAPLPMRQISTQRINRDVSLLV
jgi:hypothetical protein